MIYGPRAASQQQTEVQTQNQSQSPWEMIDGCPDEAMEPVKKGIVSAAKKRGCSPALIRGETGVGKQLVAKAIHDLSDRKSGPFVHVDCTNLDPNLMRSELFGHEPGSFTGCLGRHIGYFEEASGGTLFLDEAGDIPGDLQSRLLQAVETRNIYRVGGTKMIHCDIRVVAATNRDLPKMVREKQFREDLFYRLNVAPINVPPLRKRQKDIVYLANIVAGRLGRQGVHLSDGCQSRLVAYSWPGNVRQLVNVVEGAVAEMDDKSLEIQPEQLVGLDESDLVASDGDSDESKKLSLEQLFEQLLAFSSTIRWSSIMRDLERAAIIHFLKVPGLCITKMAKRLGMTPETLTRKINEYKLRG